MIRDRALCYQSTGQRIIVLCNYEKKKNQKYNFSAVSWPQWVKCHSQKPTRSAKE